VVREALLVEQPLPLGPEQLSEHSLEQREAEWPVNMQPRRVAKL